MIALVLPTLNAGALWNKWLDSFNSQCLMPSRVLVLDSSSEDNTCQLAEYSGMEVINIPRLQFNHGRTRQLAVDILFDAEIIIFMTQDALLANSDSIKKLIDLFSDNTIGVAYGRQLPHKNSNPIGAHARIFNYPNISNLRSFEDKSYLGIKAAFISNSFAAYRRSALIEVGGFPSDTILSEDTYVAAKMLINGWKVSYCANSTVYHSHDYSFMQEFKRYFDHGVFHSKESWIREAFGSVEGEGMRFVISEVKYLLNHAPWLIPSSIIRTLLKYTGYRLGLNERKIPVFLKRKISMHKGYWSD
jgi:rhamnosyltransferase